MHACSRYVVAVVFSLVLLGRPGDGAFAAAVSNNGESAATAKPLILADSDRDRRSWSRKDDDDDDRRSSRHRSQRNRGYLSPADLEGTIWVAKEQHRRVTVTIDGQIEIKEGKDIYVRFLRKVDDILVFEVRWWNASATPPINVLEHGVLTQIENNIYRYIEADQLTNGVPEANFPGIIGRGTFELLGKDKAKIIQIGHLVDGSASGFTTILERTDSLPTVPVDQTYP